MVSALARQRSSNAAAAAIRSGSAIAALRCSIFPWQADGGGRERRHAFAAPDESELLAGRRLHGHAGHVDSGDLGDARPHGVTMRADARSLADDIDVEMRDTALAGAQALDREGEKTVGGRAAPL